MSRVLQITDTHIVGSGQLANGVVDTAAALTTTVQTVEALRGQIGPIDLILVTGDLTDHGRPEEFAAFKRLIAPLDLPVIAVPGNHDDRENMRVAFQDTSWMPADGPINLRVDLEHVTILALDTLVDGAPHGELSETTLRWLETMIADVDGRSVLCGMHHPPMASGIELMDRQGLRNSNDLASILRNRGGNTRLCAGHLHRNMVSIFAGHLTTVCPGTSHAVTLDLGKTVNNSLTLEPGGMQLHCFGESSITHTIPIGAFDGPFDFSG